MGRPLKSEWIETKEQEPVITSDFEHQIFLLGDIEKKTGIKNMFDFFNKELQLSNISLDDAKLFILKFECVQDWYALGLTDLAEKRFAKLVSRFRISRSVSGFERLMQTAVPSVTTELTLKAGEQTKPVLYPEKEEEEGEGIVSRLSKKIRG